MPPDLEAVEDLGVQRDQRRKLEREVCGLGLDQFDIEVRAAERDIDTQRNGPVAVGLGCGHTAHADHHESAFIVGEVDRPELGVEARKWPAQTCGECLVGARMRGKVGQEGRESANRIHADCPSTSHRVVQLGLHIRGIRAGASRTMALRGGLWLGGGRSSAADDGHHVHEVQAGHEGRPGLRDQTRSNRSRFITLTQAATKSLTNLLCESSLA